MIIYTIDGDKILVEGAKPQWHSVHKTYMVWGRIWIVDHWSQTTLLYAFDGYSEDARVSWAQ